MLHFHSSSLLSGLLLGALCLGANATIAGAQPVPKDRVKVKAPAPELGQIPVVFSVSTSGDASALGSSGDYLPSGADVDPQTKGYYIEVKASVTLPATVNASVLPNTIQIQARRILYQTTPAGVRTKFYTGDTVDFITLQQSKSAPSGQNQRIYFYERYPPTPYNSIEELETARVENDWNVSKVMGRWEVRVHPNDGPSNLVEVKINKRAQITSTALDWTNYYQYKQANAASQAEFDTWNTTTHPDRLWSHCFSFSSYVYERQGLTIPNNDGTGMFGAASAPDDAPGSLRFFWTNEAIPKAASDPGHVGVIGPNTTLGYGTRIDNNGKPDLTWRTYGFDGSYTDHSFNGPLWRAKDEGVGATYFDNTHPTLFPKSQTLPGQRNPTISLLQELDGE